MVNIKRAGETTLDKSCSLDFQQCLLLKGRLIIDTSSFKLLQLKKMDMFLTLRTLKTETYYICIK